MCNKGFDKSYEQWSFLEKFKGWNAEFNKEIIKVAEEQGVELRKVFGKAISNMLRKGTETQEIIEYATDCFSLGRISDYADLQLSGMKEPINCWYAAYVVELGEELWQIKFGFFQGDSDISTVGYSKAVLDKDRVEFGQDGEAISWHMPEDGQLRDIKELRGM